MSTLEIITKRLEQIDYLLTNYDKLVFNRKKIDVLLYDIIDLKGYINVLYNVGLIDRIDLSQYTLIIEDSKRKLMLKHLNKEV